MSTATDLKLKKKLRGKKSKGPVAFFGDLKEELKKVSWTTKPELISATKIVVISIFGFGIGIYFVDLIIKGALGLIKAIFALIFG